MKRATIADVAARAGVTKSTVSHALSGKRPVSEETRQRIYQAISELGYHPHPVAQRLAGGRTRTIGFVYPLYAPQITGLEIKFITGVANVINQADYAFLLLTHSSRSSDNLQRLIQVGLVDGFILMQVHMHDPRVELLRRIGLPFVLVGRCADNDGLIYVDLDVDHAVAQCVDYLVGLGHHSLAYLHQDAPDFGFAVRALQSFNAACRRHSLSPVTRVSGILPEDGEMAMNELLAQHPDTTGVIAWSDTAAWGAARAVETQGLRVPDDISIICFDYSAISNLVPFKPTVVDIRAEEMATQAARMLIQLLEDEPLAERQILITPRFLIGGSTAPPPR